MNQVCAEQVFAEAEDILVGTELLQGQYLVQSRLSSGGFGITYLAQDSLARQVVVKECYPAEICKRNGVLVEPQSPELKLQFSALKNQFIREARQMAKMVHPNIVAVHQVFEENDTAYMALDHIDGIDLVTLAETYRDRITNTLLRTILRQSLKAINFIHNKGLLHRDIAPDNMMINSKSHLTLIDFGAAKERDETRSTLIAVKDGYSPIEFYDPNGDHGFYSDIYSLAATLYYLATGTPPPSSELRQEALNAGKPDPFVPLLSLQTTTLNSKDRQIFATVDRALSMNPVERYDSVATWAKDLVQRQEVIEPDSEKIRRNPALESEIAEIVEKTNAQLVTDDTGSDELIADEIAHATQIPTDKPVFDIFGNPVENIRDWHRKEEAEIKARAEARLALIKAEEEEALRQAAENARLMEEAEEAERQAREQARMEAERARRLNPFAAIFGRYRKTQHDPMSR